MTCSRFQGCSLLFQITFNRTTVLCTGINVEPVKKQLHITLAYQYPGEHNDKLNKLAKEIDLKADCQWELRLYSRDPRLGKSEVCTQSISRMEIRSWKVEGRGVRYSVF